MVRESSSSRYGRAGVIMALGVAACFVVTLAVTASAQASSWSLEQTPPVSAGAFYPFDTFSAVTCPSATRCIAVGSGPGAEGVYPLVDIWNGSSWSVTELNSDYDQGAPLLGVSCPGSTNCIAVGYGQELGPMWPVAEILSGTSWNEETLPFPAHPEQPYYTQSQLNAISCAPGTVCTAVGADHLSSQPLIEQLRDGHWTIQSAPLGVEGGDTGLLAVSCLSATNCTAVGNSGGHAVIDSWNGTAWSVQQSTGPGAATESSLNGVSCTYNLHCTAVGSETVNGIGRPLIESRTSTTWKVESASVPADGQAGELNAVKCRTDSGCEAVGSYVDSSGETVTLIEHQLYVKWGVQPSPNPPGTSVNNLTGVACPTSTICQAVGASDGDDLLAEVYAPG
jgi:hypothetical protein